MKTNVKIRNSAGRVIAKVTEHAQENGGLSRLSYDSESGSLYVEHRADTVTVSGTVRGDLTTKGNVSVSRVRCGGSINMN